MRKRGVVVGLFHEATIDVVLLRRPSTMRSRLPEPMQARHLVRERGKTHCGLSTEDAIPAGSVVLHVPSDGFSTWLLSIGWLCCRCRDAARARSERACRKGAKS